MAITISESPTDPTDAVETESVETDPVQEESTETELGEAEQPLADISMLEDKLPEWARLPKAFAGYTAVVGLALLFFSHQPLWHTDLWGHLSYGQTIVENGAIPQTEPLMPLARGVSLVDTAWLSQVIGFVTYRATGAPGIQFLHALLMVGCVASLLWLFHRRTKNPVLCVAGIVLFLWVEWQQLKIVRPQSAGLLCFVLLCVLLMGKRWSRVHWFLVPALMTAWANLHGSFPVGLAMLGVFCVGRGFNIVRRTGSLKSLLHDRWVRRYFLLLELGAVAALINPYGVGLYTEVFSFSASPNLKGLADWQPLTLRMWQGQAAAVMTVCLLFAYRLSPRRVASAEVLLLLGLGAATLWTSRFLVWWGPVAAYYFVLHAQATWRLRAVREQAAPSPRRSIWTVVTIGIIWLSFAPTPFALQTLHGGDIKFKSSVSRYTPINVAGYLQQHPPQGLIFNPLEWGDFLHWAGPQEMQVFVTSHVHLVPTEVWQDYQRVSNLINGWDITLDRYGVNTVVLDKLRHTNLIESLRHHDDWDVAYEDGDGVGVVFERRRPI
jgi:hypothetical protein